MSTVSHGCAGTPDAIGHLEHVQAVITLTASRRGDVEIILTSPGGTRSKLLAIRPRDNKNDGFTAWAFMTTHSWGENPVGVWKLEIRSGHSACEYLKLAELLSRFLSL
jgi:furin